MLEVTINNDINNLVPFIRVVLHASLLFYFSIYFLLLCLCFRILHKDYLHEPCLEYLTVFFIILNWFVYTNILIYAHHYWTRFFTES